MWDVSRSQRGPHRRCHSDSLVWKTRVCCLGFSTRETSQFQSRGTGFKTKNKKPVCVSFVVFVFKKIKRRKELISNQNYGGPVKFEFQIYKKIIIAILGTYLY